MNDFPSGNQPENFSKEFSDFFDRIAIGVYRSSLEGKLVAGNRALARIFGFDSVEEMRGHPLVLLYKSKRDRGNLIQDLFSAGIIKERHIEFKRRDGSPLWCSVTASAVLDREGNMAFIDGALREVTAERERHERLQRLADMVRSRREFSFLLDDLGRIRSIDSSGAEVFGYDREKMAGNPLSVYIAPKYRQLFSGFLADVLEKGSVEGILIFNDREGGRRHVEVHAQTVETPGGQRQISGIARDITQTVVSQRERLGRERFQGVLEMAGGVVHRLNQPLTVVTNLVNELASEAAPGDPHLEKLYQLQEQVRKLNEIAKKVGNIRKYKSMDYVAGVRIVDIDQAS